jgi:hypothetical protein
MQLCASVFNDMFDAQGGGHCGSWGTELLEAAPQVERNGTLRITFSGTAKEAADCNGNPSDINRVTVVVDLAGAAVAGVIAELSLDPGGTLMPTRLRVQRDPDTASVILAMVGRDGVAVDTRLVTSSTLILQLQALADRVVGRFATSPGATLTPVAEDVSVVANGPSVVTLHTTSSFTAGFVTFDSLQADKCP